MALLGLGASAAAQPAPRQGFRLERWVSSPTSRDGFAVVLPDTLEHLTWSAQIATVYAYAPLVLRDPYEHLVVAHRLSGELTYALGLWDKVEVYGRVPMTWASLGEDVTYEQTRFSAPGGFALGDLAVGATAHLWSLHGFDVGARGELILPTGNRTQLVGDSALAPRLSALASYTYEQITVALNGGYVYRPHRDYALSRIGQELEWGAALRFDTRADYEVSLEAFGSTGLRDRAGSGAADTLDVLVGARKTADTGVVRMRVSGALGGGFSAAAGDPRVRALLMVALEPRPTQAPSAVVPEAEDRDGDGVPDARDECPRRPEDHDGFEDEDGCPDDDNDGDGVLDAFDACPDTAGPAPRGCPALDSDHDGIPDESDRCPSDPEDLDGDRDEDGCPERDSDGDGLTDESDACPDVPGPREAQGCRAGARFQGDHIALHTPLRFDGAELPADSAPTLDDVAALLTARPRVHAVVHVEAPKQALAEARARNLVAALIARGIAADRLRAEGVRAQAARLEIRLRAEAQLPEAAPAPPGEP